MTLRVRRTVARLATAQSRKAPPLSLPAATAPPASCAPPPAPTCRTSGKPSAPRPSLIYRWGAAAGRRSRTSLRIVSGGTAVHTHLLVCGCTRRCASAAQTIPLCQPQAAPAAPMQHHHPHPCITHAAQHPPMAAPTNTHPLDEVEVGAPQVDRQAGQQTPRKYALDLRLRCAGRLEVGIVAPVARLDELQWDAESEGAGLL